MFPASRSDTQKISLLWRGPADAINAPGANAVADDLRVKVIAEAIAPHVDYLRPIHNLLTTLLTDEEALRYRQNVFEDCLLNPAFTEGLRELLPQIRGLAQHRPRYPRPPQSGLAGALPLDRAGELYRMRVRLEALLRACEGAEGRRLAALAGELQRIVNEPAFTQMTEELPELRAEIRQVVSVTIGVNLSPDLKPVAATLLSLNKKRFPRSALFPQALGH